MCSLYQCIDPFDKLNHAFFTFMLRMRAVKLFMSFLSPGVWNENVSMQNRRKKESKQLQRVIAL